MTVCEGGETELFIVDMRLRWKTDAHQARVNKVYLSELASRAGWSICEQREGNLYCKTCHGPILVASFSREAAHWINILVAETPPGTEHGHHSVNGSSMLNIMKYN